MKTSPKTKRTFSQTCVKKLQRCLKEKVRFRILYDQKKVSYFCSVKDKVPDMQRAHVIIRD